MNRSMRDRQRRYQEAMMKYCRLPTALLRLVICVLSTSLLSCTHTHLSSLRSAGDLETINKLGRDEEAEILTQGADSLIRMYHGLSFTVDPDSAHWVSVTSQIIFGVASKDLLQVRFEMNNRGALEGLAIAGPASFLVGAILGNASESEFVVDWFSLGLTLGVLGGGIGSISGGVSASDDIYRFK